MKIYLNKRPVNGPWGGGNRLLTSLVDELNSRSHDVVFSLQRGIDLIICLDPRMNDKGETIDDIVSFSKNNIIRSICRLGDVGTHNKPVITKLWRDNIEHFDSVISPSEWAIKYLKYNPKNTNDLKIIHNAPLREFHNNKKSVIENNHRLVTHHWSDNELKGFTLYDEIQKHHNFTYIGRKPQNYQFGNFIGALDKKELINELSNYSLYLSASKFEAGANHVLEAMALGLPVIYSSEGGSIVEYCSNYGIQYNSWDIKSCIDAINECDSQFEHYVNKVLTYSRTMNDVINEYVKVIENG